ncbi:DUF4179 domain-containing protein [Psychrobacillus sp. INOP01]|uniref:DUF4179 domain-containing protein n=1 Tax=Psychrobacillus sp. INOP01 TaxID=2829187 RepID=UPI001BA90A06|nr:DUF4179 domain-containing protein [Psychrobacillus sp. INOP01]QUG41885.1 DUF4179 domain-containing protein [Psychrobacillus sp. INOP01]
MKDIFEHFNNLKLDDEDFKEMEVSEVEKARVKARLKQSIYKKQSHQMRKQSTRKKWGYGIGAAVLVFGLLVASATVSPAMAQVVSSIPLIGQIYKNLGDIGLKNVSEAGLSEFYGESKTINGITITLGEIYYDDARVTASFSVDSEKPIASDYFNIDHNYKGGMPLSNYGLTTDETSPTNWTGILKINYYTFNPDTLELGMTFEGKQGELFEFTKEVVKAQYENKIDIAKFQQIDNLNYEIHDIKWGTPGFLISYDAQYKEENYGREVNLEFEVVDSSNKRLKEISWKYGKQLFEPLENDVTELTITPYAKFDIQRGDGHIEWKEHKLKPFKITIP